MKIKSITDESLRQQNIGNPLARKRLIEYFGGIGATEFDGAVIYAWEEWFQTSPEYTATTITIHQATLFVIRIWDTGHGDIYVSEDLQMPLTDLKLCMGRCDKCLKISYEELEHFGKCPKCGAGVKYYPI